MLNPFPEILFLALLGYFLVRIALGGILIYSSYIILKKEKGSLAAQLASLNIPKNTDVETGLGIVKLLSGLSLFLGFYTQIGAILAILLSVFEIYVHQKTISLTRQEIFFYILVIAISISLLFTGAGFFAFDRPL